MGESVKVDEYEVFSKSPVRYHKVFSDITEYEGGKHLYFGQWMWVRDTATGELHQAYVMILDDGKIIIPKSDASKKTGMPAWDELEAVGVRFRSVPLDKPDPRFSTSLLEWVRGSESNPDETECFDLCRNAYEAYIDFSNPLDSTILALYTVQTYLLPVWNTIGYIAITGIKRSGKSKTLAIAEQLCFNAVNTVSITASSLFRIIDERNATLLIDEADFTSPEKKGDIRDLLLKGYQRGATVQRTEKIGDRNVVRFFDAFGGKIIVARRGEMEPKLWDRVIPINLQRTRNPVKTRKAINPDDFVWQDIRDHLALFALKHWREVEKAYRKIANEVEMEAREFEKWAPLLTLAKFFGVFEEVYKYALEKAEEIATTEKSEEPEIKLLRVCLAMIRDKTLENIQGPQYFSASEISDYAKTLMGKESWMAPSTIGRMLTGIFALNRKPWKIVKAGKPHYLLDKDYLAKLAVKYDVNPENPLEE